jgi:putative OPT family oligopeptide transporter
MIAAISIGSVICIAAAIAGDTSQDLKTGYVVGATPWKQQLGEIFGVAASAVAIGFVLYLLNAAWGYGSTELPAPQAGMMKMIVEGVMDGNLPWALVFVGVFLGIVVEILRIPVLPFAVGLYLPIYLSTPMMVGGLVRLFVDRNKKISEDERKEKVENGTLFCSGLIAGEGLVGVLLAVFAVINFDVSISGVFSLGQIGGCVCFLVMVALLVVFINKKSKKNA